MNKNNKIAKIFTMEQQFPCGQDSSCCGPIGQSEQEVTALRNAIEKLGLEVEIYDVQKIGNLKENPSVFKLFRTFGPNAVPIIAVDNEVVCMGKSATEEVISAVKSRL